MDKVELIRHEIEKRRDHNLAIGNPLFAVMAEEDIELLSFIDSLQEEPVSEDLKAEIKSWLDEGLPNEEELVEHIKETAYHFANWQKKQDQSTIELAEDHAYFAGRIKTIDEIKEALLSEVLPCFMHGGEAGEVVAKLDEVLNKKK